jgi:type I restriction enzyme S subunit
MNKSSLPRDWRLVKFGDVVDNMNETTKDPESMGLGRVVGLDHMDPESLTLKRWDNLSDLHDGTSFTRVFRSGQVLFGKRRAYQRKVSLPDFGGICSGDILVFQPKNEELLPEFLPYLVQSDGFFDHALGTSAGSLSPRTKWQELAKYEFALPPIAEQHRIIKLISLIDEAINSYQSINTTEIISSIITEACSETNTVEPLSAVAQLIGGGTPLTSRNEFWGTEIYWATPSDLTNLNGFQISSTSRQITALGLKNSSTKLLPSGSVLLTTRASIGYVAINEVDMCINQGITGLVCNSKILPKFLMYQLLGLKLELGKMTAGSTFPEITRGRLAGLSIHVPTINLQEVAIEKIEQLLKLGASISSEIQSLRSIRKVALDSETLQKQVSNV